MKKTGVILGTLCIVAAILYFLVTTRMGKVTAADFLPAESVVCIEQRDLGQLLDDFKVSRLGRAVIALDPVKIATDLGLSPEEIKRVKDAREQLDEFLDSPVFQEFLGKEFTIGLLPVPGDALDSPEKSMESTLLFIAKPRHNVDILEMLTSLFARKLEQATTQHGKYSLKHYLIDEGKSLSVAIAHGYVIAAFDELLVQQSLDRYDSKQGSLAQKKEYIRLRHDFMKAKLFTYVSMPKLHGQLSRLSENLDPIQKEDIQKAIDQWKGWEGLAFGVWKEKGLIRDKAVVLFQKDKLDPLVGKMCSVQPGENKSLAMIPADILGYYWSNTLDMNTFWKMFSREMKDSPEEIQSMEEDVKKVTGVELQQLFAMFGSEAVFLLKDIATDGFIPLPNGAIFLKIEKEDEFVKMLQPLLAKIDIPTKTEEYKGVKVISWEVSFHPSLQPVYALHQGYLILASTVDLVKKVIDSEDGVGLVSEERFQQVNDGLKQGMTKENNSVSFIRFSSLLHMLKELANWGGTMLSMQDPEAALKSKVMLEQLILPLLDGLAMYEVIGSRSVVQDDAIILESTAILIP
jgi:hypothetical protein